jgi:2,4-dienoyl-CoA reductase-like NADH-dependent reductase (Old Yellow Enzyme family)
MEFKHLLSPVKIGSLTIRNRIVFPPIDLQLHDPAKAVDPRCVKFLSSLVRDNGVGLVISEFTAVADGDFWMPASRLDSDEFIPEFARLAEAVKSHGARFFMQLALLGGRAPKGRCIAPSAIESPLYPGVPEELSREEIKNLVQKWIEAALRAKQAGFDGVEVHGGHSYLIGEFMSPHANRRDDEYGYDFNGRMRFPTEIVRGIKDACGKEFPVGFKFSAYEALEDGIKGSLAIDMARRLEKTGVDYLHVSSSTYMLGGTKYPDVPPIYVPEGPLVEFAARIRKGVTVPVITVAGIVSPEFAERIVIEEKADLVALGRAMFADTEWASKVSRGKAVDVRPCIRCNFCHKKMIIDRAGSVECAVNPGLLRGGVTRATKERKVVVVGAGPAGLEAALQASERGHNVSLYEKETDIGGNLRIGAIPPFKKSQEDLLEHYRRRLMKSRVQFFPEQELSAKQIVEKEGDAVVIAVGSTAHMPDIPGIDQPGITRVRVGLVPLIPWKRGLPVGYSAL